MNETETRSLELERTIQASPDEVWDALTTVEGLERWFPLEAKVEPGVGGSIWLSWGPGSAGEAPIRVWDPPRHFGWTESYGTDESGLPIQVAVDFHVEGRDGATVVRLVQSGFSASSEWDEMYDALKDGWTYFLFQLAFSFLRHRGKRRRMVWRRQKTALPREEVWLRLKEAGLVDITDAKPTTDGRPDADVPSTSVRLDEAQAARPVTSRTNYHFAAVLPDLDDAIWFVELEGRHVGFWLSLYDPAEPEPTRLQKALDTVVEAALELAG